MKTIHVAEMVAQGGRDGTVETPEGWLSLRLSTDERAGSLTPEHLFAAAYASCFLGALKNAAQAAHLSADEATVTARAHLEEDEEGGYELNVDLRAALPEVKDSDVERLLKQAHQTCPYSKATRGNINVNLSIDKP